MIVLVILLTLQYFAAGEHLLTFQSPVQAVVGDDVTLDCNLKPNTDLSGQTVDVKINGNVAHAYRHGQDNVDAQADQFRGRTGLNHTALTRGVLSVTLYSVQEADSGSYKFWAPKSGDVCYRKLIVTSNRTATIEPITSSPPVDAHHEINAAWIVVAALLAALPLVAAAVFILVKKGVIKKCGEASATAAKDSGKEYVKVPSGASGCVRTRETGV